uniref:Uncharacterized protein n=1 Tax=Caenorhabditis japonica TaxID=281687 RepID=A0A8R1I373_CAEJA
MISTGPAQVQQYALVSLAKRGSWLLLAAQHNFSTASAQHQHLMSAQDGTKTLNAIQQARRAASRGIEQTSLGNVSTRASPEKIIRSGGRGSPQYRYRTL